MTKKILSGAALILIATAIVFGLGGIDPVKAPNDFMERGYVTDRDPAQINQALYLVYEEPGAPALDIRLSFDPESICRFGSEETRCIAINQTIIGAYGGKRVFVEGVRTGDEVLVRNLAFDIEAGRRFGFIRSVEKNGIDYLVTIDPVEFLSGDAAYRAAAEDTECSEQNAAECVPSLNNDFYIRNTSAQTEVYNLLSEADIALFESPGSPVLIPATADEFAEKFKDPNSLMASYPWRFILNGATIISLQEQYLP